MIELTTSDGKKYKLGFTRNVIKQMVKGGFDFKVITSPGKDEFLFGLMLDEFFENAFKTYNPKITSEEIAEALNHLTKEKRDSLSLAILKNFNDSLLVLRAMVGEDDEGTEKNGSWKVI